MDVVLGLVAALEADSGVQSTAGSNVFDFEIPVPNDLQMPEKLILVKPHGGPKSPDSLQLNYSRVQIQCYGETPHLSYVTYVASYLCLKNLVPSVWKNTYIHNCIQASGPIPGRDVELQWPFNIATWLVKASDLTVS